MANAKLSAMLSYKDKVIEQGLNEKPLVSTLLLRISGIVEAL